MFDWLGWLRGPQEDEWVRLLRVWIETLPTKTTTPDIPYTDPGGSFSSSAYLWMLSVSVCVCSVGLLVGSGKIKARSSATIMGISAFLSLVSALPVNIPASVDLQRSLYFINDMYVDISGNLGYCICGIWIFVASWCYAALMSLVGRCLGFFDSYPVHIVFDTLSAFSALVFNVCASACSYIGGALLFILSWAIWPLQLLSYLIWSVCWLAFLIIDVAIRIVSDWIDASYEVVVVFTIVVSVRGMFDLYMWYRRRSDPDRDRIGHRGLAERIVLRITQPATVFYIVPLRLAVLVARYGPSVVHPFLAVFDSADVMICAGLRLVLLTFKLLCISFCKHVLSLMSSLFRWGRRCIAPTSTKPVAKNAHGVHCCCPHMEEPAVKKEKETRIARRRVLPDFEELKAMVITMCLAVVLGWVLPHLFAMALRQIPMAFCRRTSVKIERGVSLPLLLLRRHILQSAAYSYLMSPLKLAWTVSVCARTTVELMMMWRWKALGIVSIWLALRWRKKLLWAALLVLELGKKTWALAIAAVWSMVNLSGKVRRQSGRHWQLLKRRFVSSSATTSDDITGAPALPASASASPSAPASASGTRTRTRTGATASLTASSSSATFNTPSARASASASEVVPRYDRRRDIVVGFANGQYLYRPCSIPHGVEIEHIRMTESEWYALEARRKTEQQQRQQH